MAGGDAQRMNDGLKKLLGDIGQLMATPDADQQFLAKLQQAIYTRMGQPSPQGQGAPGQQPGGMPGAAPPQGAPGQPPGPPHAMPGGGVGGQGGFGGAGLGNAMPNPDELRRILQGGAQA